MQIHDQLLKNSPPVPDLPESTPLTPSAEEAEPVDDDSGSEGDSDPEMLQNVHELRVNANAGPIAVSISAGIRVATTRVPAAQAGPNVELPDRPGPGAEARPAAPRAVFTRRRSSEDFGLTVLAIALTIAIIAVFINRMLNKSAGSLKQAPVDT